MNALIAIPDGSDIAIVVERARSLLDDGDVMAARMLAAGAYDQAKAAAGFASRFGAAERLVSKSRQLQGDALLIEARAKIQLAREYDAAQEAGAVAGRGRPKNVPDGNIITADDLGLTRKDIHEARKLAEAELCEPGIVEQAIAARLEAGLEPSRASLRANIGTKSATNEERGHNLYESPIEAVRTLLALERFSATIWEPACGKGAIMQPFEAAGYDVIHSDLVDYGTANRDGEIQQVADFLRSAKSIFLGTEGWVDTPDIVTNPPYGDVLNGFVAHALREHRPRKMALLLNLNFLCGFDDPDRRFAMDEHPPSRIHVFTRRLPMMHRDGWDGPQASSSMNTAWFVWELDRRGRYGGPAVINRVDWKEFQDRSALSARPSAVAAAPQHGDLVDQLIEAEASRALAQRAEGRSHNEEMGS